MQKPSSPPSASVASPRLVDVVKGLAHSADCGHFDELQGKCLPAAASAAKAIAEEANVQAANAEDLSSPWRTFFEQLGNTGLDDLDRRTQTLARQIRDNGVSYNVYADNSGPQRPWSLVLFG